MEFDSLVFDIIIRCCLYFGVMMDRSCKCRFFCFLFSRASFEVFLITMQNPYFIFRTVSLQKYSPRFLGVYYLNQFYSASYPLAI